MKSYFLLIFVLIIFSISGCTQFELTCPQDLKTCPDGTKVGRDPALNCEFRPCPQVKEKEPIEILLSDYNLLVDECTIDATVPIAYYSLNIDFVDTSRERETFNSIYFSVMDPDNNASNLLSLGSHPATGDHWDGIGNRLQSSTYFMNYLTADKMEIVWESINVSGHRFNGTGYIEIKKRIEVAFPDIDPQYYPPQTIPFECINGRGV